MSEPSLRKQMPSRPSALAALLLLTLAGCAGGGSPGGGGAGASRGALGEIHLFGVPVALNLDGVPGPDALGVRVYASAPGTARGIAIRQGVLELLMYDGPVAAADLPTSTPRKVWRFEAANLRPFAAETSLGMGYQLALRWERDRPRTGVVTVVARYRSSAGAELYSTPSAISVPPR